jgi:cytochrome P450
VTATSARRAEDARLDPWDATQEYSSLWPLYKRLRDDPLRFDERHGGYWALTRYAEVRAAAADPTTYSSVNGVVLGLDTSKRPFVPVEVDPPLHAGFRGLLQPLMTRAELDGIRSTLGAEVERRVRLMAEEGHTDGLAGLADPLPVFAIATLIGLDADEAARMRSLAVAISTADRAHSVGAVESFQAFLAELIADRRRRPRGDHLSRLAVAEVDGQPIADDTLITLVQGLILAGHHTTITALSFLLLRVAELGLLPSLAEGPRLHTSMAHEVLRFDPPIHLQGRTLTRDVTVRDTQLSTGDYVLLVFAAAHRDEREFADPDRFDPRRPVHHMTFGYGIHRCVGMPLAVLEMELVLDAMSRLWSRCDLAAPPELDAMLFGHHVGVRSLRLDIRGR